VKGKGLGLGVPYFHNGQDHDYYPDFLVRLACEPAVPLLLEVKGFDPLEDIKRAAAERWVAAVNAEGSYGRWRYAMVKQVSDITGVLTTAQASLAPTRTK
jgi:type III restriction enzyme